MNPPRVTVDRVKDGLQDRFSRGLDLVAQDAVLFSHLAPQNSFKSRQSVKGLCNDTRGSGYVNNRLCDLKLQRAFRE